MNGNRDNHDSTERIAATDFGGHDNLTALETPTALRRPDPNGDEKIPTGRLNEFQILKVRRGSEGTGVFQAQTLWRTRNVSGALGNEWIPVLKLWNGTAISHKDEFQANGVRKSELFDIPSEYRSELRVRKLQPCSELWVSCRLA